MIVGSWISKQNQSNGQKLSVKEKLHIQGFIILQLYAQLELPQEWLLFLEEEPAIINHWMIAGGLEDTEEGIGIGWGLLKKQAHQLDINIQEYLWGHSW